MASSHEREKRSQIVIIIIFITIFIEKSPNYTPSCSSSLSSLLSCPSPKHHREEMTYSGLLTSPSADFPHTDGRGNGRK